MRGDDLYWPDPIRTTARFLRAGLVVALRGIGRSHLICDATSWWAVSRLREQQPDTEQLLTVMVRDLAAAEQLAVFSDMERQQLISAERPVVVAHRREGSRLAPAVAAPDYPVVGLSLPSSPLHHRLLAELRRPLALSTSSLAEKNTAAESDAAALPIGSVADLFLVCDWDA